MRVAQIVPSLETQHGGPSRSVYQLALAMSSFEEEIELLTTDPQSSHSRQEDTLKVQSFKRDSPKNICRSSDLAAHLSETSYDVIHHHALWLRTLHYAHESAKINSAQLIIAPRGMMSPWAWRHNRWKKKLAQSWIHPEAMNKATGWHATSTQEADDIRSHGFTQPICISPNSVTAPTSGQIDEAREHWTNICPEVEHRPVALFYSRFHRKKRILELIDLWLKIAPAQWLLLVVGIPEEYTVDDLASYVQRNSGADRVKVYSGVNVPVPYPVASLFLLPSHSENFGLVIAEAMAHGVPALVTDQTPWLEVNKRNCGWCVPWDDYPATLNKVLQEDSGTLGERGQLAGKWVAETFSWDKSARVLLNFYQELIARQ